MIEYVMAYGGDYGVEQTLAQTSSLITDAKIGKVFHAPQTAESMLTDHSS